MNNKQYIDTDYLYNVLLSVCKKIDGSFSKKKDTVQKLEIGMAVPTGSPFTNLRKCLIITFADSSVVNLRISDLLTELPVATSKSLGAIIAEELLEKDVEYKTPVKIDENGKLFVPKISTATTSALGLVKPDGDTITISSSGVLTSKVTSPKIATIEKAGIVKPDNETITVDANGVIKVVNPGGAVTPGGTVVTKVSELVNDIGYITSASVPTKVSELENDAGYVNEDAIPVKVSELENDSLYITAEEIPLAEDETIGGVYALAVEGADLDVYTVETKIKNGKLYVPKDLSHYNNDADYVTTDDIPTKVSDLDNDLKFISSVATATTSKAGIVKADGSTILVDADGTIHAIDQRTKDPSGAVVVYVSSLINDKGYITASDIPKNVSQLNNDKGYITKAALPKFDDKSIVENDDGTLGISSDFNSEELYKDYEVENAIDEILFGKEDDE